MAARGRLGGDPQYAHYRAALLNPASLANQPQLRAFSIHPNSDMLAEASKDRLRGQVAALLLAAKAATFSSAVSLLLVETSQPVQGLPALQEDAQIAGKFSHTLKSYGSRSDATFNHDEDPIVARCSAGTFDITFTPNGRLGWQLLASCSQADRFRVLQHQLNPPVSFTDSAQQEQDSHQGRVTPCTASSALPLDGARRLVWVEGTGGRFDGMHRTAAFNPRKSTVDFKLRLPEQQTAGVQGQLTHYTTLDTTLILHHFKLDGVSKVTPGAEGGGELASAASQQDLEAALAALGIHQPAVQPGGFLAAVQEAAQAGAPPPAHLPQPSQLLANSLSAAISSLTIEEHKVRIESVEERVDTDFAHFEAKHVHTDARISCLKEGQQELMGQVENLSWRVQGLEAGAGIPGGHMGLAGMQLGMPTSALPQPMVLDAAAAASAPPPQQAQSAAAAASASAPAPAVDLPSKEEAMERILQHRLLVQDPGQSGTQVANQLCDLLDLQRDAQGRMPQRFVGLTNKALYGLLAAQRARKVDMGGKPFWFAV